MQQPTENENSIEQIAYSPFDLLPTELLFHIISYLTMVAETFPLMLTSKAFYTLIVDDETWKPRLSRNIDFKHPSQTHASLLDKSKKRKRSSQNEQVEKASPKVKKRKIAKDISLINQEASFEPQPVIKGKLFKRLESGALLFRRRLTQQLDLCHKFIENTYKDKQLEEHLHQLHTIRMLAPLVRWGRTAELKDFIRNYDDEVPLEQLITLRITRTHPTLLGIAVESGNLDMVQIILGIYSKELNPNTNKPFLASPLLALFSLMKVHTSPLHLAVINDRRDILEFFMMNETYHPFISSSFKKNSTNILLDLIEYNPDVKLLNYLISNWIYSTNNNDTERELYTPETFPDRAILDNALGTAAFKGRLELFKTLFFYWNANIHVLYHNYTLLKYALDNKQEEMIQICVENGVRKIDNRTTAIKYAQKSKTTQALLKPHLPQLENLEQRIKLQIKKGNAKIACKLLDKLIDLEVTAAILDYFIEMYSFNSLKSAMGSIRLPLIFKKLVGKFQDPSVLVSKQNEKGETLLDVMLIYGLKNNPTTSLIILIRLLFEHGFIYNNDNFPILYHNLITVLFSNEEIDVNEIFNLLKVFATRGELNIPNDQGDTILHLALKNLTFDIPFQIARFIIKNNLIDFHGLNNRSESCLLIAYRNLSSLDLKESQLSNVLHGLMLYHISFNSRDCYLPLGSFESFSTISATYLNNTPNASRNPYLQREGASLSSQRVTSEQFHSVQIEEPVAARREIRSTSSLFMLDTNPRSSHYPGSFFYHLQPPRLDSPMMEYSTPHTIQTEENEENPLEI